MFNKKLKILTSVLGDYYKSNSEMLFHCPRCEHHKRKLSLNVDKNVFKCWVCDYKGKDIYRIIKRHGDYNQKQDWKALTSTVDVENFTTQLFDVVDKTRKNKIDLPTEFVSLVNKKLPPTSLYALNYLMSRGVTKNEIARWKIGYCDEGDFAGRIIIPSFDMQGDVNYFVARSYDREWPRYLNPQSVDKNIIFNELFLDFDEDLVLVEGAFDAIVAGPNSAPILGSTLREGHMLVQKIIQNDTIVYLGLDADAKKKELEIIKLLLKYDIEVYKVDTSGYDDIAEMSKSVFRERKQTATLVNNENYLYEVIMETL
tara:strand:+ start:2016 stop:2957 length:942 start_codon:yes stop_codon:yes gene_type:complete